MQVAVFLRNQLVRLERENIRVFVVKGNHDANNQITSMLPLPANVHVFSDRRPETITLDEPSVRVAIHGQVLAPER